ncbi:Uncharacterised protein [Candidatus Burarchaeum australiense]|nr:Uncharacterised protein [Candidatus Burarchaeum australiense]
MITGIRITKAEVAREKNEVPRSLGINMSIADVKQTGEDLEISFTYSADYTEKVGHLLLEGVLVVSEDKKKREDILRTWKAKKRLEDVFAEDILNNINFACMARGTVLAMLVNLQPPMTPPRIRIDKAGADSSVA